MFHDTSVDYRLNDLRTTAAELRAGRAASHASQTSKPTALRVRIGSAFVAIGSALVNGASPASVSAAGR
jgi:hypothetical protein